MGIFKTKNDGPVNFTTLVQTRQGKTFNRFADLMGQFRADPVSGKFDYMVTTATGGVVDMFNHGERNVSTSGQLAGGIFTNNFQRKIPYAVFDGQTTKQSVNHSDSGKTFFWVPVASGHEIMHSGWINLRSLPSGSPGGRAIFELSDGTRYSSTVYINSNGQLGYRYHKLNSTTVTDFRGKIVPQEKRFKPGEWYHYVIVVNNLGTTVNGSDAEKFNFWINGMKVAPDTLVDEVGNSSFSWTAAANGQDPATIGFGRGGYDSGANPGGNLQANAYLHAYLAELCFWRSATSFTDEEAESVYRAFSNITSGMVNITERLTLRELDQHSTHPPVARSGDSTRLGTHANTFDDSNVQSFLVPTENSKVHFPTKLVSGDKLLDNIYAGYSDGDLAVPNVSPSMDAISMFHRRADQPNHEPFVESRIYIDNGSVFYQTGTSETIIPGFSAPLHSKAAITIDIPISTAVRLGSADQTNGSQVHPTAYYNFTTNQFDKLNGWKNFRSTSGFNTGGSPNTGSAHNDNINYAVMSYAPWGNFLTGSTNQTTDATSIPANMHTPSVAGPKPAIAILSESSPSFTAGLGRPTDIRGFPSDNRFFASGSQTLSLKNVITQCRCILG